MQDKGIIIISTGHPYYAHMAANLAVSIRYHDKALPIALVHDSSIELLDEWKREVFQRIEVPKEMLNGDPYYIKLNLDKLTPFKKTLYLDADIIWNNFKGPQDLFNELDGIPFTMISRAKLSAEDTLLSRWIDVKALGEAYKTDDLYDVSSEVMYFEEGTTIFSEARKAYKKPKVSVSSFGAGLPDEAFFMMAMAKTGTAPHQTPWEPTYWEPRHFPKQHSRAFIGEYYAMSVGGAFVSNHIKKIYDSLMSHYYNSLGIAESPYQLIPKSRILKERRKI
jgi:hypothetical protein